MAHTKNSFIAYLKDGTPVGFTHAIDYRQALAAGLNPNPPGTVVAEKPKAPEGEKIAGISPIIDNQASLTKGEGASGPAPVVEEKEVPPVAKHAEDKAKRKLNR